MKTMMVNVFFGNEKEEIVDRKFKGFFRLL